MVLFPAEGPRKSSSELSVTLGTCTACSIMSLLGCRAVALHGPIPTSSALKDI